MLQLFKTKKLIPEDVGFQDRTKLITVFTISSMRVDYTRRLNTGPENERIGNGAKFLWSHGI